MNTGRDADPGLFGVWPLRAEYGVPEDRTGEGGISRLVLEIKSADGAAQVTLQVLLNQMTGEMQAQFEAFRKIRVEAGAALDGSGDEAVVKLAKADIKAAVDAMQVLMRTLEKIDSLQRSLAHERALEAERNVNDADYEAARQKLLDLMDERANERARTLFDQWKRTVGTGGPGEGQAALAATCTGPPFC